MDTQLHKEPESINDTDPLPRCHSWIIKLLAKEPYQDIKIIGTNPLPLRHSWKTRVRNPQRSRRSHETAQRQTHADCCCWYQSCESAIRGKSTGRSYGKMHRRFYIYLERNPWCLAGVLERRVFDRQHGLKTSHLNERSSLPGVKWHNCFEEISSFVRRSRFQDYLFPRKNHLE